MGLFTNTTPMPPAAGANTLSLATVVSKPVKNDTIMPMVRVRHQTGFTISEIIIVVTVLGILALIVTLGGARFLADARDEDRVSDVTAIMAAAERYYAKNGEYPYNADINPTSAMGKLPNYTAVKTLMPELSDDSLSDSSGYNFWAIGCIGCSSTAAQLKEREKQYIYFSTYEGYSTSTLQYPYSASTPLWGCSVSTTDTNPGFMIAWRSESTGLWIFKRGIHGQITISDFGSRPAEQTCTWS
jgi:prepilin-type N-terminal cleavage/methylation domain-containing protein